MYFQVVTVVLGMLLWLVHLLYNFWL